MLSHCITFYLQKKLEAVVINAQKAHCSVRTLQDFLSFSINAIFVTHFYFVISTRTIEMMKHSILRSVY